LTPPVAEEENAASPVRPAVSARAVALGIGCAALLCAVTPYNDYKVGATYLAGHQFPVGAIFVLFVLAALANPVLRAWRPRSAFAPGEMLTVWTLILVASGLPSSGLMRFLLPHIAAPTHFSNGVNNWEAKVWGGLPAWLRISDKAAADAYFTGYPRGAEHVPWGAWAAPLLGWGVFALLFFAATFCVASLLRRQWIENEKFVFPLVTLPMLLAAEPEPGRRVGGLLRAKGFWLAVALTTVLHTLNGLHLLYPTVPAITTNVDLNAYLTAPPWDQIGATPAIFYPLVVGLAYLLSAEVAFSLWFFFLFYKAEALVGATYNWYMPGSIGSPSEKQFHALQAFGGAVALLGWTLWTARRHLADVWEKATNGPRAASIDDSREMLSYRATLVGLAVSYAGMALWMHLATVPPVLIAVSLLLLTVSFVTVSWLVTQAGTLYTVAPCVSIDLIGGTAGTHPFTPGQWYMAQRLECVFYRDTRELLLPEVLSGAKAADGAGFSPRRLLPAMLAAVAVGAAVSLVASLWLPYHNGGANSLSNPWAFRTGPVRPLQLLGGVATAPLAGACSNGLHVLGGLLGVLGLLFLRARTGFALHPIGFIAASTVAGRTLWFSVFLGWACKAVLSRYGGMTGYRAALPFFLGLMLGDVLNAVVWIVLGVLTGTGYNILPS
jgi:hypothetical protein